MPQTQIPGPSFLITPDTQSALDGGIAVLGNAGMPNVAFGGFGIDFVTSLDFEGSIAVVARSEILDASDNDVTFVAWPVRPFYLNGAVPESFALQNEVLVTGRSYLVVPAPGVAIGLLVSCSVGSCMVYWQQLTGNTIP